MNLKFNFFNLIILFGTFQGLLLIALINILRPSRANRLLSLLLLAFSLNTLKMMLFDIGLFKPFPALYFFPFFFFLIGPGLFCYAKTLSGLHVGKRELLIHFSPFTLNFLYYAICLALQTDTILVFHLREFRPFEEFFSLVSVGAYTILTLRLLRQYNVWRLDYFSDDETGALNWLRNLTLAVCFGWTAWAVLYVLDRTINYFDSFDGAAAYYPLYIYMSVFIYWIGYSGYVRKVLGGVQFIIEPKKPAHELTDDEKRQLDEFIATVQDKKLFTQPALKLHELASVVGLSSKLISFMLNHGLKKNFHDFINELRIEDVKEKLRDPQNNHFTIQSLAEEAGFASRSTFHDLFRKYVNVTPKEYKEGNQT